MLLQARARLHCLRIACVWELAQRRLLENEGAWGKDQTAAAVGTLRIENDAAGNETDF